MAADEQLPAACQQLRRRQRRRRCRLRNETLFVLSLVQGLCAAAALILCAVAFSTRGPVLTAMADAAAALLVMCVSGLGIFTSRRKTYCTVLALFVLCQLACLAAVVLLVTSSTGLQAASAAAASADATTAASASDLVIGALTLLIGFLELGVALASCLVCARQICRHDARIALDPRGRGLIVLEAAPAELPAPPLLPPHPPSPLPPTPPGYYAVALSPPPPPASAALGDLPPAYAP